MKKFDYRYSILIFLVILLFSSVGSLLYISYNYAQSRSSEFQQYKHEQKILEKYNYYELRGQLRELKKQEVTATAYTASVDECNEDVENTATMKKPIPGWHIAVSHDLIWMLGEKVYIEKVGVRKVADLMNKRYKNRIDILMPTKEKANNFGKKKLKITIIN